MASDTSSDKKRLTTRLQVITSALLSPQSPQDTSPMSFFKRKLTPKSSPKPSPTPSPVNPSRHLYPGDSKFDYNYGQGEPSSSTSHGYSKGHKDKQELPPPYYPQSSSDSKRLTVDTRVSSPSSSRQVTTPNLADFKGENPLKVLAHFDIVIVLDDSYSMLIPDRIGGRTRWDQAWDALEVLVDQASRYAPNAIEMHFLNNRAADTTVRNANDLRRLRMRTPPPTRDTYTPLGDVLDTILLRYMSITGTNPQIYTGKKKDILVITDGEASDDPVAPIVQAAKFYQKNRFPHDQIGIQFVQVGDDEEATQFLQSLDEDLVGEMGDDARDIVDTMQSNGRDLDGKDLIKALTGGFNRKLDRMGEHRE